MSFLQRQIAISIALAQNTQTNQPNTFAESGTNQVNIQGLRTSVQVRDAGSLISTATVKIWGLTPSLMNQLSSLGLVLNLVPKNIIAISAGNSGGQLSTIFKGTIWNAYGDYSGQPDVPFVMTCNQAGANNIISSLPTSYPNPFSVATAMSNLASKMGLGFAANGVSVMLPRLYLSGSPLVQARKLADAANVDIGFSPDGNTLEITTKTGSRQNQTMVKINKQTGMIGYPAFTQQGIIVKTLFNPQLAFKQNVEVDSIVLSSISNVQAAKGQPFPTQWTINKLDLDLDAYLPRGQWMSTIYGYNPARAGTILPPSQT